MTYQPGGPIPHNMAKTFDGPPTLERSGSKHRRAVTSFLLRRKAWLEVELPLAEGTEKDAYFGKTNKNPVSFNTCEQFSDGQILNLFCLTQWLR